MTLKEELRDYQARWMRVETIIQAERRSASPMLRWRQLNAAFALGKALGLLKSDPEEMKVVQKWAMLKEKAVGQNQKALTRLFNISNQIMLTLAQYPGND